MRFLFSSFLFLTFLFADVQINDINFTDSEISMSLVTLNHIDYYTLKYYLNDTDLAKCIIDWRYNNRGILTVDDFKKVVDDCEVYKKAVFNIKQCSYKFATDLIVDPKLGTTYPQTNFLYALTGILIGFTIFFAVVMHFVL